MGGAGVAEGSLAAVDPQLLRLSREEHDATKELFASWERRLGAQVKRFQGSAAETLKADKELSQHMGKMRGLRAQHEALRTRQEAVDHAVDLIWQQQDALEQLMQGLQKFAAQGPQPGKETKAEQ